MIGHLSDVFENSRKTSFSDLFSDGKPAEISRDFEPTAPFILFTCVALHKPRFGAGQQSIVQFSDFIIRHNGKKLMALWINIWF